jgi:hypothetical protein
MSLANIFAALADELPDEIRIDGPDSNATQSRPPRITWEPGKGSFLPPRNLSTGPGADGDLWTRRLEVQVVLWHRTLDEAEALLAQFVNAVHKLLTQFSYQLGGEQWTMGGSTAHGVGCALTMTLDIPVPRTVKGTVTLGQVAFTAEIDND